MSILQLLVVMLLPLLAFPVMKMGRLQQEIHRLGVSMLPADEAPRPGGGRGADGGGKGPAMPDIHISRWDALPWELKMAVLRRQRIWNWIFSSLFLLTIILTLTAVWAADNLPPYHPVNRLEISHPLILAVFHSRALFFAMVFSVTMATAWLWQRIARGRDMDPMEAYAQYVAARRGAGPNAGGDGPEGRSDSRPAGEKPASGHRGGGSREGRDDPPGGAEGGTRGSTGGRDGTPARNGDRDGTPARNGERDGTPGRRSGPGGVPGGDGVGGGPAGGESPTVRGDARLPAVDPGMEAASAGIHEIAAAAGGPRRRRIKLRGRGAGGGRVGATVWGSLLGAAALILLGLSVLLLAAEWAGVPRGVFVAAGPRAGEGDPVWRYVLPAPAGPTPVGFISDNSLTLIGVSETPRSLAAITHEGEPIWIGGEQLPRGPMTLGATSSVLFAAFGGPDPQVFSFAPSGGPTIRPSGPPARELVQADALWVGPGYDASGATAPLERGGRRWEGFDGSRTVVSRYWRIPAVLGGPALVVDLYKGTPKGGWSPGVKAVVAVLAGALGAWAVTHQIDERFFARLWAPLQP